MIKPYVVLSMESVEMSPSKTYEGSFENLQHAINFARKLKHDELETDGPLPEWVGVYKLIVELN